LIKIFAYFCDKVATMVKELGKHNSLFNLFLSELRDREIQQDSLRFRKNLERMGEIFAYEISKTLQYEEKEVVTPLGTSRMNLPVDNPVLATILRAGLPLHQGLLNFFDHADNAFVSAYRKYSKNQKFTIKLDYISAPGIEKRVLIVSDPMVATGESLITALKALMEKGKPKHVHVVCILANKEGIDKVKKNFSLKNMTIWTGAIDAELTAQAYIVPGLGDAGDLSFGRKND